MMLHVCLRVFVGEFYPVHIKPVTVAVRSAHCGKRGPRSAPCHSNGPTSLPGRLPAWAQARRMMSWPSPRETNVQTEGNSINSIIHCCELLQDVCKCKTRVTRTSCKVRSTKKRKLFPSSRIITMQNLIIAQTSSQYSKCPADRM